MSTYNVTLHRETTKETIFPSFVSPILPYPGLRLLHESSEWEIVQVRLHIRDKDSMAARHDDPHIVDALVRPSAGMFR